jgi:gluconate 2-dehydrogenase subunit 3-like protein
MRRRRVLQSLIALPALRAQQSEKLTTASADAVGDGVRRYFSAPQYAALQKLGDLLVPAAAARPSASQAHDAEFLDFLLSQSPPDRQALYRGGLDRLQSDARARYGKAFDQLTAEQADALLAPLHQPWTYAAPAEAFARFLRAAKDDFIQATVNSREFAEAQTSAGRRAPGLGTYWYPVE